MLDAFEDETKRTKFAYFLLKTSNIKKKLKIFWGKKLRD